MGSNVVNIIEFKDFLFFIRQQEIRIKFYNVIRWFLSNFLS
jgi:hypothetical protein